MQVVMIMGDEKEAMGRDEILTSVTFQAPADFTAPEILYRELIDKIRSYHTSADISMVEKAYHLADDAHKDQLRKSGEPYIIHPLCVANILAELELDRRRSSRVYS
jgi:GTP pyrophosphokinase